MTRETIGMSADSRCYISATTYEWDYPLMIEARCLSCGQITAHFTYLGDQDEQTINGDRATCERRCRAHTCPPMTTEDRQREVDIQYVIEALTDPDDPFAVHEDLYPEAVTPDKTEDGCKHTGWSASEQWGMIEAVRQHEHQCVGR